jgi:hypothetical protein
METKRSPLGWPEKGFILFSAVSIGVAMATPTPLLQDLSLSGDSRIFPTTPTQGSSGFDLPPELGHIRIEPALQYGCIQLRASTGQSTGPICNRRLLCRDKTETAADSMAFEVFKLPTPNAFYVETGSACNSACCDWRGMSFTGDGKRLDDSLLQRLSLRLGLPGFAGLLAGFLCLAWVLRARTGLSARAGMAIGFGAAMAMLWWNH